jgi:hypothetical protein
MLSWFGLNPRRWVGVPSPAAGVSHDLESFGRRKRKTMSDEQKIAFADTIASLLELQLAIVG